MPKIWRGAAKRVRGHSPSVNTSHWPQFAPEQRWNLSGQCALRALNPNISDCHPSPTRLFWHSGGTSVRGHGLLWTVSREGLIRKLSLDGKLLHSITVWQPLHRARCEQEDTWIGQYFKKVYCTILRHWHVIICTVQIILFVSIWYTNCCMTLENKPCHAPRIVSYYMVITLYNKVVVKSKTNSVIWVSEKYKNDFSIKFTVFHLKSARRN